MKACGSQEENKNVLSPPITITLTSGVTLLHVKLEGTVFLLNDTSARQLFAENGNLNLGHAV